MAPAQLPSATSVQAYKQYLAAPTTPVGGQAPQIVQGMQPYNSYVIVNGRKIVGTPSELETFIQQYQAGANPQYFTINGVAYASATRAQYAASYAEVSPAPTGSPGAYQVKTPSGVIYGSRSNISTLIRAGINGQSPSTYTYNGITFASQADAQAYLQGQIVPGAGGKNYDSSVTINGQTFVDTPANLQTFINAITSGQNPSYYQVNGQNYASQTRAEYASAYSQVQPSPSGLLQLGTGPGAVYGTQPEISAYIRGTVEGTNPQTTSYGGVNFLSQADVTAAQAYEAPVTAQVSQNPWAAPASANIFQASFLSGLPISQQSAAVQAALSGAANGSGVAWPTVSQTVSTPGESGVVTSPALLNQIALYGTYAPGQFSPGTVLGTNGTQVTYTTPASTSVEQIPQTNQPWATLANSIYSGVSGLAPGHPVVGGGSAASSVPSYYGGSPSSPYAPSQGTLQGQSAQYTFNGQTYANQAQALQAAQAWSVTPAGIQSAVQQSAGNTSTIFQLPNGGFALNGLQFGTLAQAQGYAEGLGSHPYASPMTAQGYTLEQLGAAPAGTGTLPTQTGGFFQYGGQTFYSQADIGAYLGGQQLYSLYGVVGTKAELQNLAPVQGNGIGANLTSALSKYSLAAQEQNHIQLGTAAPSTAIQTVGAYEKSTGQSLVFPMPNGQEGPNQPVPSSWFINPQTGEVAQSKSAFSTTQAPQGFWGTMLSSGLLSAIPQTSGFAKSVRGDLGSVYNLGSNAVGGLEEWFGQSGYIGAATLVAPATSNPQATLNFRASPAQAKQVGTYELELSAAAALPFIGPYVGVSEAGVLAGELGYAGLNAAITEAESGGKTSPYSLLSQVPQNLAIGGLYSLGFGAAGKAASVIAPVSRFSGIDAQVANRLTQSGLLATAGGGIGYLTSGGNLQSAGESAAISAAFPWLGPAARGFGKVGTSLLYPEAGEAYTSPLSDFASGISRQASSLATDLRLATLGPKYVGEPAPNTGISFEDELTVNQGKLFEAKANSGVIGSLSETEHEGPAAAAYTQKVTAADISLVKYEIPPAAEPTVELGPVPYDISPRSIYLERNPNAFGIRLTPNDIHAVETNPASGTISFGPISRADVSIYNEGLLGLSQKELDELGIGRISNALKTGTRGSGTTSGSAGSAAQLAEELSSPVNIWQPATATAPVESPANLIPALTASVSATSSKKKTSTTESSVQPLFAPSTPSQAEESTYYTYPPSAQAPQAPSLGILGSSYRLDKTGQIVQAGKTLPFAATAPATSQSTGTRAAALSALMPGVQSALAQPQANLGIAGSSLRLDVSGQVVQNPTIQLGSLGFQQAEAQVEASAVGYGFQLVPALEQGLGLRYSLQQKEETVQAQAYEAPSALSSLEEEEATFRPFILPIFGREERRRRTKLKPKYYGIKIVPHGIRLNAFPRGESRSKFFYGTSDLSKTDPWNFTIPTGSSSTRSIVNFKRSSIAFPIRRRSQ